MILHRDRYFEHVYDVKHDMVCVKWPTIESLYLPEILNSISILVDNIKNYNIKHLLIDASETGNHTSEVDADRVVRFFMDGLKRTRLEKLARVESANADRENLLKEMLPGLNSEGNFEVRFFKDVASALQWLQLAVV